VETGGTGGWGEDRKARKTTGALGKGKNREEPKGEIVFPEKEYEGIINADVRRLKNKLKQSKLQSITPLVDKLINSFNTAVASLGEKGKDKEKEKRNKN
jgi:hypothetical protein